MHILRDGSGVRPHEHHHDANHRLAAAVPRYGPLANHRGELDRSEVLEVDRRASGVLHNDDLREVAQVLDQPLATDEILLVRVHDVAAADVPVVLLEGLEDRRE